MKQLNIYKPAITLRKAIYSMAGLLLLCTIMSGIVLASTTTHAVTKSSTATVNVTMSCTMSTSPGTGGTATTDGYSYSTTIDPGQYAEISGTVMTTTCTGTGNYSLYAIGYSGDSYDTPTNTQMISSNAGVANIPTGTATSGGTSNWAFKLATSGSYSPTIISPYNNYANIPGDDFTKIATYIPGTTGSATSSSVQAKYRVYITSTQPVGTYTGKVKYTMVYPNDAPAPKSKLYMQDMVASDCTTTATTVYDNRDGEAYKVQRLADGKCWMLDNLRLDLTNSTILNGLTTSNTHVDANSLTSLKSGNRSAGAQYASSGFVKWDSSSPDNVYNQAKANADYKDTTTTSYGEGSGKIGVYYNYCAASAGSYCYDSGAGTGNASYDLCPAGWRMPTGNSSGEYGALYTAYSSDATSFRNALSTPLSGNFNIGSAFDQGSSGRFWSSTYNSGNNMYNLRVNSSDVYPPGRSNRLSGYSLRCLLGS